MGEKTNWPGPQTQCTTIGTERRSHLTVITMGYVFAFVLVNIIIY